AQMNEVQERKRELLARSDACRASLGHEVQNIRIATAWVPRVVRTARSVYPVLLIAVPLVGYLITRRRPPTPPQNHAPSKRGLIASALAGYRLFRQVKPVLDQVRAWRS